MLADRFSLIVVSQATASAVAAVVATPDELSPQAQDQALDLLGSIASQGSLVTPGTAGSVAGGLSSVVSSVEIGARRRRRLLAADEQQPADPRFSRAMDVVSGLADSLASILSVPGEESIMVSASALQVRPHLIADESRLMVQCLELRLIKQRSFPASPLCR